MGFPTPTKVADHHWTQSEKWPAAAYVISSSQAEEALVAANYNRYNSRFDGNIQVFYRLCFDLEEARKNIGCVESVNPVELREQLNVHHGCLPGFNKVTVVLHKLPIVDVARQWVMDGNSDILGVYQYPSYARKSDSIAEDMDDILHMVKLSGKVFFKDVPRRTQDGYSHLDQDIYFKNSERTTVIRGVYVLDAHYDGGAWLTYNPKRAGTLLKRKQTMCKVALSRPCARSLTQILTTILSRYHSYLWTDDYHLFSCSRYMKSYLTLTISSTIENIHVADRIARDRRLWRKMTIIARPDILDLCYYASILERKSKGFILSWLVPRMKMVKAGKSHWKLIRHWTKDPEPAVDSSTGVRPS